MQYTYFFVKLLQNQGVPHLTVDQTKRLYNILIAEERVRTLNGLNMNSHDVFKKIRIAEDAIKRLSKGLEPEAFFNELIMLSDSYYKNH